MPLRRLKRTIALMLFAALALAQASVALAACAADRGDLARSVHSDDNCPCGPASDSDELASTCVAHCTADLQAVGDLTVIARAPADSPVLVVAPSEQQQPLRALQDESPPGGQPARILFQSFLI